MEWEAFSGFGDLSSSPKYRLCASVVTIVFAFGNLTQGTTSFHKRMQKCRLSNDINSSVKRPAQLSTLRTDASYILVA